MSDVAIARSREIEELLDKHAIREVMMRYCRGVDRFDAELISSAYHPDAVDEHGGWGTFTGKTVGQDIVNMLKPFMKVTTHHITNQTIQLHGDSAGCESYYACWHVVDKDG